ncbi:MAG TPA: hypothetical protein PKM63_19225, partial [Panacibacter sp.]|nr:hypothetical protein [Panacibacter sp.]HNP46435.1 hypothetical protein [Panacibacter sp.]
MFLKKILFFVCLSVTACNVIFGQRLDAALRKFYELAPVENVYIQFDNNNYFTGQTIFYKAYLSSSGRLDSLSKNFYVDWYSDSGTFIASTVTPITYGFSIGSFDIPGTYAGTNIYAVGYTTWMRNFDPAFFFQKSLGVFSLPKKIAKRAPVQSENTVQFLPESGNALVNKASVVAFKSVNWLGLPQSIDGEIKDKTGSVVTEFHSDHDGMGKFYYVPLPGESYIAEWKDIEGKTQRATLPDAKEMGISLIIEPGIFDRKFHIQRTESIPQEWKNIKIIAQMNGLILYRATAHPETTETISGILPVGSFRPGILQVTLFDANDKPLCERQIFINNSRSTINGFMRVDTLNNQPGGHNSILFEVKDSVPASFSISVVSSPENRPVKLELTTIE